MKSETGRAKRLVSDRSASCLLIFELWIPAALANSVTLRPSLLATKRKVLTICEWHGTCSFSIRSASKSRPQASSMTQRCKFMRREAFFHAGA